MEQNTFSKKSTNFKQLLPWALGYAAVCVAAFVIAYFWRVVFELGPRISQIKLSLQIVVVFTLIYIAFFCINHFCKDKFCLKSALCVFLAGLIFCFANPPQQTPDEGLHYLRAYSVSQGHFNYDHDRVYPNDVALLFESFPAEINHKIKYQLGELATPKFSQYFSAVQSNTPASQTQNESYGFNIVPYIPQALFMAVARLFGFKALGLVYAARIANLLCYSIAAYFIFKNCNKFRGVFIAIVMLPLSLFLAASCSTDALVLISSYLAISYLFKEKVGNIDLFVLAASILFSAYLKAPNLLLVAIIPMIPSSAWKAKIKPWQAVCITALAFLPLFFGFKFINEHLLAQNYPQIDERPRGADVEAGTANTDSQLGFILKSPLRFISILMLTLFEEDAFIFNLGTFGWLDMTIPLIGGLSVVILLVSAVLSVDKDYKPSPLRIGGIGATVALLYVGLMTSLYITHSHVASPRITGLQPRYFLPTFLLLFIGIAMCLNVLLKPRTLVRKNGTTLKTENLLLYITFSFALFTAFIMFQNYFIGQWVRGSESWKLVNIFGWVYT